MARHAWGRLCGGVAAMARSAPKAAWVCALVGCLNAVGWSFVTPPFQVPDEPAHFAYVAQLARAGATPSSGALLYPADEEAALRGLHWSHVERQPVKQTIASLSEQRALERDLSAAARASQRPTGAAGNAASEPPFYYALQTIPYELGSSGGVLAQLQLMRLLSALLAGATALFAFLFLREALPAVPWAWTVGGLAVALAPLLAFMSGGVSPDAGLIAVSTATFYCLARAFRRGLTRSLAVAIGALIAAGLLTKLPFVGLTPGIVLGLAVLAYRASRSAGAAAFGHLAVALAVAAVPVGVYVLVNALSGRPGLGLASGVVDSTAHPRSLGAELGYIWQLYLPRLPGMSRDFADISSTRDLWFDGLVGQYGWVDTVFPGWAYDLALVLAGVLAALCARSLLAARAALRRRLPELCVYAAMAVGLLVVIGSTSYSTFPEQAAGFAEPRYLLPLIPLAGAAIALAARGAGRRWGATAGALIVVLFIAYDGLSQLQVVARYYG